MKKTLLFVLIMILLIVSSALAGDLDAVKKAGALQFGVSPDRSPFVFYDADDEITGIDIEMMAAIADRMGLRLDVVEMSSDDLMESLTIGQVDVIGGAFSKTASRQNEIDFSKVYYVADPVFVARIGTTIAEPLTDQSFSALKLGVLKNSGFEDWVLSALYDKGLILKKNIYTYDKTEDALRALDRNRIDLMLMDYSLYQARYQNSSEYRIFEFGGAKDSYAFGVRKGSDLRAEINTQLTAILKDGTAQTIADKFFTMSEEEDDVTLQWSNKNPSAAATPAPSATALPAAPLPAVTIPTVAPTAAPAAQTCSYSMSYVTDVTIPDGQPISGGSSFTKTWRLKNTGNCAWTTSFMFVYVSGAQMNGANRYLPYNVNPGETLDISIDMVAPTAPGTYQGYWQLRTPQGFGIGFNIWVQIVVPGAYTPPTAEPYTYPTMVPSYPTAVPSYPTATSIFSDPMSGEINWMRTVVAMPEATATPKPWHDMGHIATFAPILDDSLLLPGLIATVGTDWSDFNMVNIGEWKGK